jgi:hypothetical protein
MIYRLDLPKHWASFWVPCLGRIIEYPNLKCVALKGIRRNDIASRLRHRVLAGARGSGDL